MQVGILVLVSGWLVSGGPAPARIPDVPPVLVETASTTSGVARVVGAANPDLSARELERIGAAVVRYSAKYRLDPELVTAVLLVESGGRPWARSPKGAMGLMQVMPYMLSPLDLAGNYSTIESNIEAGCLILADNIRRYGEEDGISAYFWGPDVRGVAYLQRVQAARAKVRRLLDS
jgi:soluble lytic murein transglycosylase-like protein